MPPPPIPARQICDRPEWAKQPIPAAPGSPASAGDLAVRTPILDAGLSRRTIDGMLSYQGGDSNFGTFISGIFGIRLISTMDVNGRGSSTEALDGHRDWLIEAGCCKVVANLSLDERYSQIPPRRHGARSAAPVGRRHAAQPRLWAADAGQSFATDLYAPHCTITEPRPEQVAMVRWRTATTPSNNPKAYYKKRFYVEGCAEQPLYLQAAAPLGLLRRDRHATAISS